MSSSSALHRLAAPNPWTTVKQLEGMSKVQEEMRDNLQELWAQQANMASEVSEVLKVLNTHFSGSNSGDPAAMMGATNSSQQLEEAARDSNAQAGGLFRASPTAQMMAKQLSANMFRSGGSNSRIPSPGDPQRTPRASAQSASESAEVSAAVPASDAAAVPAQSEARRGSNQRSFSTLGKRAGGPASTKYFSTMLHPQWPQCVQLLDGWKLLLDDDVDMELSEQVESLANAIAEESYTSMQLRRRPIRTYVMHPNSGRRNVFDMLSLSVLTLEFIVTPFTLAWDLPPEGILYYVSWMTACFWAVDIVLNFFTGYRDQGEVVLQMKEIAMNYIQTWFPVDLLAVTGDTLYLFFTVFEGGANESATRFSRILRIAKLSRFLRLLGLMRMLRVIKIINRFMESRLSEAWRLCAKVLQMSCAMLWFAHFAACLWFAIGKNGPTGVTGEHWVDTPLGIYGRLHYLELGELYQYSTVYHWAVAQITLGAHDINPANSIERIFTVLCNLFGLVFGGTLVSVLSASLLDFRETHRAKADRLRVLRQFLHQHGVDIRVATQVICQVEDRMAHSEDIVLEDEVPALSFLSTRTRTELRYSLYGAHLSTHHLFLTWQYMDRRCLEDLCCEALEFQLLYKDDELFISGNSGRAAYHIIEGKMDYTQEEGQMDGTPDASESEVGSFSSPNQPTTIVNKGSWLSWATLWVHWVHPGTSKAIGPCKMLAVSAQCVGSAVAKHSSIRKITQEYARCIHHCIVSATPPTPPPTDVSIPFADFMDLVPSMDKSVQRILAMAALEKAASTGRLWQTFDRRGDLQRFESEVKMGRSVVLLDEDGHLRRLTAVTVLQIEHGESVLAQLAKYDQTKGAWEKACVLPGSKQESGELPSDAIRRIATRKIAIESDALDYVEVKGDVKYWTSKQYGIRTRYIRTVYLAKSNPQLMEHLRNYRLQVDVNTLHTRSVATGKSYSKSTLNGSARHSRGEVRLQQKRTLGGEDFEHMELRRHQHAGKDNSARDSPSGVPWPPRKISSLRTDSCSSGYMIEELFLLPGTVFAWLPKPVFQQMSSSENDDELNILVDWLNISPYMMAV